ncbi:hypothetical protein GGR42_002215 [Saonia flava]|uniref:DUF3575 domain-containing protein n=1 Tax=Saonia flava TaxID=523696 RepID=A0A846QZZ5_9FLAO|nr:hypothetical protein [Saonia flava]NJB71753.1 hypothetical protein [Saonia flava]
MTKTKQKKKSKLLSKIALLGLVFLCGTYLISAQSTTAIDLSKNNVYVDTFLGIFAQASINYERQIYSAKEVTWYGRLGAGAAAQFFGAANGYGGLGGITMLTGKKNGHFELNGNVFVGKDSDYTFVHPIATVGYRYQKPKGGFIFRANTSFITVGVSLGYAF